MLTEAVLGGGTVHGLQMGHRRVSSEGSRPRQVGLFAFSGMWHCEHNAAVFSAGHDMPLSGYTR